MSIFHQRPLSLLFKRRALKAKRSSRSAGTAPLTSVLIAQHYKKGLGFRGCGEPVEPRISFTSGERVRNDEINDSLDFSIFGHYSLIDYFYFRRFIMNKQISLAEAKATLSECIRKVESGKTVLITRHGKPVAALVRAKDLENFERLKKAGPEGGLASLAGGWKDSEEVVRILDESSRVGQRNVEMVNE